MLKVSQPRDDLSPLPSTLAVRNEISDPGDGSEELPFQAFFFFFFSLEEPLKPSSLVKVLANKRCAYD